MVELSRFVTQTSPFGANASARGAGADCDLGELLVVGRVEDADRVVVLVDHPQSAVSDRDLAGDHGARCRQRQMDELREGLRLLDAAIVRRRDGDPEDRRPREGMRHSR